MTAESIRAKLAERREVFEEYERRWSVQLAIALRERDELRAKLAEADDTIRALHQRCELDGAKLAEAERAKGEPFCYAYFYPDGWRMDTGGREVNGSKPLRSMPLYTAPQPQPLEGNARTVGLAFSPEKGIHAKLFDKPQQQHGGRPMSLRECMEAEEGPTPNAADHGRGS